jgi:hypothetical protein
MTTPFDQVWDRVEDRLEREGVLPRTPARRSAGRRLARRRAALGLAAGLAVAAGVALAVLPREDGYNVRGGRRGAALDFSVRAFVVGPGGTPREVRAPDAAALGAGDSLVLLVSNAGGRAARATLLLWREGGPPSWISELDLPAGSLDLPIDRPSIDAAVADGLPARLVAVFSEQALRPAERRAVAQGRVPAGLPSQSLWLSPR